VDLTTIAQLAAATANICLTVVFGIGYYIFLKQNRAMLEHNRQILAEMRASRTARGRPQVVVEAGYAHLPMVDIVVRNVGGGAAQDIEFDFSAPIVRSTGFHISELSYFKEGMNFLDSGEEVRSLWDNFNELASTLREQGQESGITVSVRYLDLAGGSYEDRWTINPLLYEDETTGLGGLKGMSELVIAVEELSEHVEAISKSIGSREQAHGAAVGRGDNASQDTLDP
jgi:hypothetical protein